MIFLQILELFWGRRQIRLSDIELYMQIMIYSIIVFLLCYVVYTDVAKRKIFNWVSVVIFFLAVIYKYFVVHGFFTKNFTESLIAMGAVFLLFFCFYRLGWMGGGDVKFAGVLAFFLGIKLFSFVFIFSVLISLFFFIFRKNISLYKYSSLKKVAPYGAFMSFPTILLLMCSRGIYGS